MIEDEEDAAIFERERREALRIEAAEDLANFKRQVAEHEAAQASAKRIEIGALAFIAAAAFCGLCAYWRYRT